MRTHLLPLSLVLALACDNGSASAQDMPVADASGTTTAQNAEGVRPNRASLPPTPFTATAVDDEALGAIAGRENTRQVALNEQSAGVSRNSVGDNSVTGEARISDNAFQNMSGLSILNVNTGNNVAINAAMNVNISITPGQ